MIRCYRWLITLIFFFSVAPLSLPINLGGVASLEALRVIVFFALFGFFLLAFNGPIISLGSLVTLPLILFLIYFSSRIGGGGVKYAVLDCIKLGSFVFVLLICDSFYRRLGGEEYAIFLERLIVRVFYVFVFVTALASILGFLSGVRSPKSGAVVILGPTGRALTAMTASLFTVVFYYYYSTFRRRLYLLLAFVSTIILLGTLVRIAIGAAGVGVGLLLVFRGRIHHVVFLGAVVVSLLVLFSDRLFAEMFVVKSAMELSFSSLGEIIENIKFTGRLEVWQISLGNFFNHFWFGGGSGSSNHLLASSGIGLDQNHNDYIKVLSDGGVVGLALYLFFYFNLLVYLLFCRGQYRVLVLAVVSMLLVFSLTDNVISYFVYLSPFVAAFFPLSRYCNRQIV